MDKCTCPYCQLDITGLVEQLVQLKLKQARDKNAQEKTTHEQVEKAQQENLVVMPKKRKANPDVVRANAIKASHARTAETFARQRQTVKETMRRKNIKFAELLFEAKSSGMVITPELESELLQKATMIIKKENKIAKSQAKKAAKLLGE